MITSLIYVQVKVCVNEHIHAKDGRKNQSILVDSEV